MHLIVKPLKLKLMQRTVFYLFMLLAFFSCSVDDGNANYIDFYEFVPIESVEMPEEMQKYLEKPVSFLQYLVELKQNLEVEKYLLYTEGKIDVFVLKWNLLYEAI